MKANTINDLIDSGMINGNLSNENLVEIIKLCSDYLNLRTVAEFHKETGISKQGIYKHRQTFKLRTFTYVIDNE